MYDIFKVAELQFNLYEEVQCEFIELFEERKELFLHIKVNGYSKFLYYTIESKEAQILLSELDGIPSGSKIGILKTDVEDKPLYLRIISVELKEDE